MNKLLCCNLTYLLTNRNALGIPSQASDLPCVLCKIIKKLLEINFIITFMLSLLSAFS